MIIAESAGCSKQEGYVYHLIKLTRNELRIVRQALDEYPDSQSEPNTFEKRLSRKLAKQLGDWLDQQEKKAQGTADQCRRSTDERMRELLQRLRDGEE